MLHIHFLSTLYSTAKKTTKQKSVPIGSHIFVYAQSSCVKRRGKGKGKGKARQGKADCPSFLGRSNKGLPIKYSSQLPFCCFAAVLSLLLVPCWSMQEHSKSFVHSVLAGLFVPEGQPRCWRFVPATNLSSKGWAPVRCLLKARWVRVSTDIFLQELWCRTVGKEQQARRKWKDM